MSLCEKGPWDNAARQRNRAKRLNERQARNLFMASSRKILLIGNARRNCDQKKASKSGTRGCSQDACTSLAFLLIIGAV